MQILQSGAQVPRWRLVLAEYELEKNMGLHARQNTARAALLLHNAVLELGVIAEAEALHLPVVVERGGQVAEEQGSQRFGCF